MRDGAELPYATARWPSNRAALGVTERGAHEPRSSSCDCHKATVHTLMAAVDDVSSLIPEGKYLQLADACKVVHEAMEELCYELRVPPKSSSDLERERAAQAELTANLQLRVRFLEEDLRRADGLLLSKDKKMYATRRLLSDYRKQENALKIFVRSLEAHLLIGPMIAHFKAVETLKVKHMFGMHMFAEWPVAECPARARPCPPP